MTDDEILTGILKREGGYIDHPSDRGGCTNMGITIVTLAAWRGRDVTCADVKALTVDEAKSIYRAKYIAPFSMVDPAVREQVIDIAVNSGVKNAWMLLERATHQTKRALPVALVIERLKFYARIVEKRPSQSVFLAGWVSRAVEFLP